MQPALLNCLAGFCKFFYLSRTHQAHAQENQGSARLVPSYMNENRNTVIATSPKPLPANVLAALQSGNKMVAIKLLREASGLGLKEAKDVIDEYDGRNLAHAVSVTSVSPLPEPVLVALRRGHKVEAIRLLREMTGLGLKEAKDWVDAWPQETQSESLMAAPGEVPKSGNLVWWGVAAAVAAFVAYHLFRNAG